MKDNKNCKQLTQHVTCIINSWLPNWCMTLNPSNFVDETHLHRLSFHCSLWNKLGLQQFLKFYNSAMEKRGRARPKNKTSDEATEEVRNLIKKFPMYESHNGRIQSKRKFLSQGLNITIMYDDPLFAFREIFNTEFNLTFKRLHTDTCKQCDLLTVTLKVQICLRKFGLVSWTNKMCTIDITIASYKRGYTIWKQHVGIIQLQSWPSTYKKHWKLRHCQQMWHIINDNCGPTTYASMMGWTKKLTHTGKNFLAKITV